MAKVVDERDATLEDLQLDVLTARKGTIFYQVNPAVLRALLPGAKVRRFAQNDILFTQGKSSKDRFFYILLDAAFSVTHIVSGYPVKVADDQPAAIAGDVENMVRGIPASVYNRQTGETDSYLSTVACTKGGKVLLIPEANMRESNDFQLAWNIGTSLAIKLIQRNMPIDAQLTADHDRIVGFLREHLSRLPAREIEPAKDRQNIDRLGRRVDLVEDADVTYYDIREFVYRYDLTWEGRKVTMPNRVFDMLMNDPTHLPLAGKSRIEIYEWRRSIRKKEEATGKVADNA